jgi:exonuclease SbcD
MLRVLHTSDWHLGHTLHELPRAEEHAAFLAWLLDAIRAHAADSLLVSGDIFDTANPPAEAQRAFYRFLAAARRASPALDLVVIGGNHDSAARLDATNPVLDELGVRVVGELARRDGELDFGRLVVPLTDSSGATQAWVAAVPYLRPVDLPIVEAPPRDADGSEVASMATMDGLIEGVRAVYARVIEAARRARSEEQALLAMGHCYMTGSKLSELSERRILGGNQHALPVDIFPEDVAYVALGHLHLAQRVGGREHVRYSGSPIPLALDEERYNHQALLVTLDGTKLTSVESLPIPRVVPIVRVGATQPLALEDALTELAQLAPRDATMGEWRRPYLEVNVQLSKPEPELRHRVDKALEGKAARLVRLRVTLTGAGGSLADVERELSLKELRPEDVFRKRYASQFKGEQPTAELMDAFAELLELAHRGEP